LIIVSATDFIARMKVRAVCLPTIARDLKPGDLWSYIGPIYWDTAFDRNGSYEMLMVRTNTPVAHMGMPDEPVWRIIIQPIEEAEDERGLHDRRTTEHH
jgi:hypothetical protein